MATLTVRLLGSPEITVNQRSLSFRTRKALALLIYLVTERGMHSREALMALLWSESSSKSAADTLRGTLSRLRRALQPGGKFCSVRRAKSASILAEPLTWTWPGWWRPLSRRLSLTI